MPTRFDIAVIGAGIAGASAALAAAQQGARVCIFTHRPGATSLFSGGWRGPLPDGLDRALRAADYILEPVEHPLPHQNGFLMTASYATSTHRAAQLQSNTTVYGITGLPGFDAEGLAMQWSAASGFEIRAETLTLPDTPAAGWSPATLQSTLTRDPQLLQQHDGIFPPVLGATATLPQALSGPPSLPGFAFANALLRALQNANIEIVEARVDKKTVMETGARAFVLATGKYISGGIEADREFREPVFDCPIWIEHLGDVYESVDPLMLTDADRDADQPLLAAGVHTDDEHRPVNRTGDVVYPNVFVAGSIREGWNTAVAGIGDAALDGWNTGLRACR